MLLCLRYSNVKFTPCKLLGLFDNKGTVQNNVTYRINVANEMCKAPDNCWKCPFKPVESIHNNFAGPFYRFHYMLIVDTWRLKSLIGLIGITATQTMYVFRTFSHHSVHPTYQKMEVSSLLMSFNSYTKAVKNRIALYTNNIFNFILLQMVKRTIRARLKANNQSYEFWRRLS